MPLGRGRWLGARAWLGMAVGSVGGFLACCHAQVKVPQVPLTNLWVEAEGHRDAGRWVEAAGLAERVLQRVDQGERMPSGMVIEQVRVLATLLRERAAVNTLLFVGPNEQPREPVEHLTALARRNGGRFALLTARSLAALPPAGP